MTQADILRAATLCGTAFMVGLSGAMSPGPYLTVTISRTLSKGRLSAFLMLVGHALLEAVLLLGFAFGLQHFLARASVVTSLGVIGGAVLLWMGTALLLGAVRGTIAADLEAAEEESGIGPIAQGALVSISNPYWTLWWATIGVTLAAKGLAIGPVGVLAFFVGHQLADITWYAFVILAVSKGRHLLSPAVYRTIIGQLAHHPVVLGGKFLLEGILAII